MGNETFSRKGNTQLRDLCLVNEKMRLVGLMVRGHGCSSMLKPKPLDLVNSHIKAD